MFSDVTVAGKARCVTNVSDTQDVCMALATNLGNAFATRAGAVCSATKTSTTVPITSLVKITGHVSTLDKDLTLASVLPDSMEPTVKTSSAPT